MSYNPSPVPQSPDKIPAYLRLEMQKLRFSFQSTEGQAQYISVTDITSDYTVGEGDFFILVDTTSGNVTVTLPEAWDGRVITVKKEVSANTVTVATPGSETIDGSATQSITTQYESISVVAHDGNWWIR